MITLKPILIMRISINKNICQKTNQVKNLVREYQVTMACVVWFWSASRYMRKEVEDV